MRLRSSDGSWSSRDDELLDCSAAARSASVLGLMVASVCFLHLRLALVHLPYFALTAPYLDFHIVTIQVTTLLDKEARDKARRKAATCDKVWSRGTPVDSIAKFLYVGRMVGQ